MFCFLLLAALGLHCCAWAFSSCGERALLFVAVRGLLVAVCGLLVAVCGLLVAVASLAVEHRL